MSTLFLILMTPLLWAAGVPQYYVLVSAYQNARNEPNESHSFATFIKVTENELGQKVVEKHTISWLPRNFANTRNLRGYRGQGKNFSLEDTLKFAKNHQVWHSAVYPISETGYLRALRQKAFLDTGGADYQMIDIFKRKRRARGGKAINCIHAISDMGGFLRTGTARGIEASQMLVKHLTNARIIQPGPSANWLLPVLIPPPPGATVPSTGYPSHY